MPRDDPWSFPFFEVGDLVESVPDTRPGIHPSLSVHIFGRLEEIRDPVGDGGFRYRISSIHHKQNMVWVEEYQIQRVSSSVFGKCYMEPRAGQQKRLEKYHYLIFKLILLIFNLIG